MELDRDLSEFIECCVARDVRFLIVGGYAVAAHGHPRYTKDLDVWVWIDGANAERLVGALGDFGFGSLGVTTDDFARPGSVVQLGHPPKRIDLLTSIDGVDFDVCWPDRVEVDLAGREPAGGEGRPRRGRVEPDGETTARPARDRGSRRAAPTGSSTASSLIPVRSSRSTARSSIAGSTSTGSLPAASPSPSGCRRAPAHGLVPQLHPDDHSARCSGHLDDPTGQGAAPPPAASRRWHGDRAGEDGSYLPLLETVYLTRELPAWSRNPVGRVTKHPKGFITDSGLAASLQGVTAASLEQPIAPLRGRLVETFVHNELVKQRTWAENEVTFAPLA